MHQASGVNSAAAFETSLELEGLEILAHCCLHILIPSCDAGSPANNYRHDKERGGASGEGIGMLRRESGGAMRQDIKDHDECDPSKRDLGSARTPEGRSPMRCCSPRPVIATPTKALNGRPGISRRASARRYARCGVAYAGSESKGRHPRVPYPTTLDTNAVVENRFSPVARCDRASTTRWSSGSGSAAFRHGGSVVSVRAAHATRARSRR